MLPILDLFLWKLSLLLRTIKNWSRYVQWSKFIKVFKNKFKKGCGLGACTHMTHMKISFVGKNQNFWKFLFFQNFYMKSCLCCVYMWVMFYVLWTWFEIFMKISHGSVPFQTVKTVLKDPQKTIESRLNGLIRLVFHTTHEIPNKARLFRCSPRALTCWIFFWTFWMCL